MASIEEKVEEHYKKILDELALPAVPVQPAVHSVRQKVRRPVSHIYLRREPPFSRRRALGVMLPRYLYDAALWPLSAEIAM